VGFWKDEAEIASLWSRDRVFDPQLSRDAAGERLAEWKRAVDRSRGWARDA
jgi:glycerol kinase